MGSKVNFFVDDEELQIEINREGTATYTHIFTEKGPNYIRGVFQGDNMRNGSECQRNIRIIEYREEIIDQYNEFSEAVRRIKEAIPDHFTPREVMNVLTKYSPDSASSLGDIVYTFEFAKYSLHDVKRPEYERFYLAKIEYGRGEP